MSDTSAKHHDAAAQAQSGPIRCAVLTVSDTRTLETDASGDCIVRLIADVGHELFDRKIVRDDPTEIGAALHGWVRTAAIQVILITGGTGIARRDSTIEVVRQFITTELEGFGELFRMISFAEIGSAAMLSRAIAGLVVRATAATTDKYIFAMPGSPNAVETAMSQLILPELPHLIWERRKRNGK